MFSLKLANLKKIRDASLARSAFGLPRSALDYLYIDQYSGSFTFLPALLLMLLTRCIEEHMFKFAVEVE